MSRLDRAHACRRVPPKRRLRASFRPRPCIEAEHGDIAAEARCLQNACSRIAIPILAPKTASIEDRFHGKEGVDGSSPSEGLPTKEIPANRLVLLSQQASQSTSLQRQGNVEDHLPLPKGLQISLSTVRRSTSVTRRASTRWARPGSLKLAGKRMKSASPLWRAEPWGQVLGSTSAAARSVPPPLEHDVREQPETAERKRFFV
jgi:hypothetical protein